MTAAEIKAMIDESFHAGQSFPIDRVVERAASLRRSDTGRPASGAAAHQRWLMDDRAPQSAGDTAAMVVRDSSGLTISALQSNGHPFGSLLVSPDLGFVLHNRGSKFNLLDPAMHVNGLLPGRRPHHTLSPWMVTYADSGLPFLAAAMKGGDRQPYAFLQMFSNLVDQQLPLSHAIAAPRFRHSAATDPSPHQPVTSLTEKLIHGEKGAPGDSLVVKTTRNTTIQVERGFALSHADVAQLQQRFGITVVPQQVDVPFEDSGFGVCQALHMTYTSSSSDEEKSAQKLVLHEGQPGKRPATAVSVVSVEAVVDAVRKPGLAVAVSAPTRPHKMHGGGRQQN
jgi:hypothetical protein